MTTNDLLPTHITIHTVRSEPMPIQEARNDNGDTIVTLLPHEMQQWLTRCRYHRTNPNSNHYTRTPL